MILGPRAELQGRRALQISGGEISGLFNTPLAISIYCLIALVLLWPLINRFLIRRIRPRPDHAVHHGHTHALVELAEELAGDGESLAEQERVLARAERETAGDTRETTSGRRDAVVARRSSGYRRPSGRLSTGVSAMATGTSVPVQPEAPRRRHFLLTGEGRPYLGAADPGGGAARVHPCGRDLGVSRVRAGGDPDRGVDGAGN